MGNGYRVGQKAKFPGTGLPCLVPLYLSRAAGLATALFRGGGALGPDLDSVPAGIEFVVAQLKSMVLALGLMDLRLTVEQAVLLSRLEEEYQVRAASTQKRGPQVQTDGAGRGLACLLLCKLGLYYFCVQTEATLRVRVLSDSPSKCRCCVPALYSAPLLPSPLLNSRVRWGCCYPCFTQQETEAQGLEPGL